MKTQPLFNITFPAVLSLRPGLYAVLVCLSMAIVTRGHAADQTWTGGGLDENWTTALNWSGGAFPGALNNGSGTANLNTATFNTAGTTTVNETTTASTRLNIKSLLFDTSSVGAFTITGSRIYITEGGSISTTSAVTSNQTINTPLSIWGGTAATYSFVSDGSAGSSLIFTEISSIFAKQNNTTLTLSGTNTGANVISGVMGGATTTAGVGGTYGVVKQGSGTWTLTGGSGTTFSLGTTVSTGTLLISNASGSGTGSGFVTVDSAGTLGGRGIIAPAAGTNVTINGTLSPGDLTAATGTLTFNASGASKVNFGASSHLALTLGTSSDLVAFTTSGDWLGGSGNVTLDITGGAGFLTGTAYNVFSNITTAGFTLAGVTYNGSALGVSDYTFGLNGTNYEINISAIPEAKTWLLIGIGLTFVLWRRRRRLV